jgi:hypothetical protein
MEKGIIEMDIGEIVFLGLTVGLLLAIIGLAYGIVSFVRTMPEPDVGEKYRREFEELLKKFLPASIASELASRIRQVKVPLFILFLGLLIILASLLLALF